MKNVLILIAIVITVSCTEPIGDRANTTLINNSGHSIEMQIYHSGEFQSVTIIDNNKTKEYQDGGKPGLTVGFFLPPFDADSIRIIYFKKASIWHTEDENSPVSRSLMLESSYEGGKVRDGLYEFTYTFTPEDYEEALEFGE